MMARNNSVPRIGTMAVADRPARDRARRGQAGSPGCASIRPRRAERLRSWFPSSTSKLTPRAVEPAAEPAQVGGGSTARPRRLDQVARHDQTGSSGSRASSRSSRASVSSSEWAEHAVAGGASGPFVAKMDIGDHSGPLARVDRRPFRARVSSLRMRRCLSSRPDFGFPSQLTLSGLDPPRSGSMPVGVRIQQGNLRRDQEDCESDYHRAAFCSAACSYRSLICSRSCLEAVPSPPGAREFEPDCQTHRDHRAR